VETVTQEDRWHELLTSRYVCEICLTRYFGPRHRCLGATASGISVRWYRCS